MIRVIPEECSFFTEGGRWDYGIEGYVVDVTVEYPEELDSLEDHELYDLIDAGDMRVRYVDGD